MPSTRSPLIPPETAVENQPSEDNDDTSELSPNDFTATPRVEYKADFLFDPRTQAPGPHCNATKTSGEIWVEMVNDGLDIMLRETNCRGQELEQEWENYKAKLLSGQDWDSDEELSEAEDYENEDNDDLLFHPDEGNNREDGHHVIVAEQKTETKKRPIKFQWKELTKPELYDFLAICFMMALLGKGTLKSYWTKNFIVQTPQFGAVMSRDRFLRILRALHFVNNKEAKDAGKIERGGENYDPLYKIRDFKTAVFNQFQKFYCPDRRLSIDKQIIPFRGNFAYIVYMKDKPHGIKVYAVCESETGYTLDGIIHCGRKFPKEAEGKGKTYSLVWELLRRNGFLDRGFELFTDNYYTMRSLYEDLAMRNLFACGTLKHTKGCPRWFLNKNGEHAKNLRRGDAMFLHSALSTLMIWKDNQIVKMLSTIPDIGVGVSQMRRKIAQVNNNDFRGYTWNPEGRINCPDLLKHYNAFMGGVDHADQMLAYVIRTIKSRRWYIPVAFYVLFTAACNTHAIKRCVLDTGYEKKKFSIRACFLEIVAHLLSIGLYKKNVPYDSLVPQTTASPYGGATRKPKRKFHSDPNSSGSSSQISSGSASQSSSDSLSQSSSGSFGQSSTNLVVSVPRSTLDTSYSSSSVDSPQEMTMARELQVTPTMPRMIKRVKRAAFSSASAVGEHGCMVKAGCSENESPVQSASPISQSTPISTSASNTEASRLYFQRSHWPVPIDLQNVQKRRRCQAGDGCKTRFQCRVCKVPICVYPCWDIYHKRFSKSSSM